MPTSTTAEREKMTSSLPEAGSGDAGPSTATTSSTADFDIAKTYHTHLLGPSMPPPIAAFLSLCDLVSSSSPATISELISTIRQASSTLRSALPDPVPASAGLDLFTRFVLTKGWDADTDFGTQREGLVQMGYEYARRSVPVCRERICELVGPFIQDDAVIMTHSYSRVVMQVLLSAAKSKTQRKRIRVYVTESRPTGRGIRTHAELTAAGVPCTLVLDSAVAYTMLRGDVNLCLLGAEGVAESGGLLNAVGSLGMALIAKNAGVPVYACAESFKFLRIFPLSQSDYPTSRPILEFPSHLSPSHSTEGSTRAPSPIPSSDHTPLLSPTDAHARLLNASQEAMNPVVDYTPPDLVSLLFSDVGVLTPSGVADALLAVYGDGGAD